MTKFTQPTEEERKILERNGIDPDNCAVFHRTEDSICLLRYKTRDTIVIHRGDKKW